MIQLKLKKDNNITNYIALIRKYNRNLSIAEIKKRIENQEYVIEHDCISPWDICDDIANIDQNKRFREFIENLFSQGAEIELFEDNRLISIELLDNRLATVREIEAETLSDIEREVGN